METLVLPGLLGIGLGSVSMLLGKRVVDARDQSKLRRANGSQGEVDGGNLGACCGFGLPSIARPGPADGMPISVLASGGRGRIVLGHRRR